MGPRSEYQHQIKRPLTPKSVPLELGFSADKPLTRLKHLQNQFHGSNASTDHLTVSSRFFQLNDRNRIKLTESVASDSSLQDNDSRKVGRIKTVESNSQQKQYKYQNQNYFEKQVIYKYNQEIETIYYPHRRQIEQQQNIHNNQIPQDSINRYVTFDQQHFTSYQQTSNDPHSAQRQDFSNQSFTYSYSTKKQDGIQQKRITEPETISQFKLPDIKSQQNIHNEQQIMEQAIDEFGQLQKNIKPINLSLRRSNALPLSQGSRVQSQAEEKLKQSFINRIHENSVFIQSQVYDKKQYQQREKPMMKKRRKIFDLPRQNRNNQNPHILFKRQYLNQPNRSPQYSHERRQNIQQIMHRNMYQQGKYNQCPHILCILKSYEIIDKLIDQNRNSSSNPKKQQLSQSRKKKHQTVCRSLFQLSVQLQAIITKAKLSDLSHDNLKKKINSIKVQIDRLMVIIRQQQYFTKQSQLSRQQIQNPLDTLKIMYQRINCLQLVQQRYLMWNYKLNQLNQEIKNMFTCSYQQQIQKLKLIAETIKQLKQNKIYSQQLKQNSWPLFVLYNQYLQNEIQGLEQTLEWSKQYIKQLNNKDKSPQKN